MRRFCALGLCLIAAVSLLAGCGSGGSTSSDEASVVHPATFPSGKPADVAPKQAVLRPDDMVGDWIVVPQKTGPAGFAEISKGDPSSLKAFERTSFGGAYEALYANAQQEVVLSVAASFHSPADAARVARGWAAVAGRSMHHAVRLPSPSGAPDHFTWWKGAFDVNGAETPAVVAQWVSGKLVVGVSMVGSSASTTQLAQFVQLQNAKILGAAAR